VLILERRSLLRISTASSSSSRDDDDDDSFTTIATDNLLSREKQEIFLSFYQELQTK